jgi:hypothetical protein
LLLAHTSAAGAEYFATENRTMVQEARWSIPAAPSCGANAKQITAAPIKRVHIGAVLLLSTQQT